MDNGMKLSPWKFCIAVGAYLWPEFCTDKGIGNKRKHLPPAKQSSSPFNSSNNFFLPWIWCYYLSVDFPSWTPSHCPGSQSLQGRHDGQLCAGCWQGTESWCVGRHRSGWVPWCHWLVVCRERNSRLLHALCQWQKAGNGQTRKQTIPKTRS